MAITLEEKWIWDSWYFHDGQRWHSYFLQADKSLKDPELRHWNVSQGHAISEDLVNWTHLGTCFQPSPVPAWDDYTTWTGSVVRDNNRGWHLFYTGSSRAENGKKQRIGHAISQDGNAWQRVGDGLCLDLEGNSAYEEYSPEQWPDRAMRDPWVMEDPQGSGWLMFFTARIPGIAEPNAGGAVGFATSDDLFTWILQPPVFSGGFGQLEVPQVFEINGQWYCLFCTAAEHWSKDYQKTSGLKPVTGSHYLIASSPRGPWEIAPGAFLDGDIPCQRYAAKILKTSEGLKLLGFVDRPGGSEFMGFVSDPDPVVVNENNLLSVIRTATEE